MAVLARNRQLYRRSGVIEAYASQPHYWRHLAPLVSGLGERAGAVWADHGSRPWGERFPRWHDSDAWTLVASWDDAALVHARSPRRRLIYVEHGAGQSYADQRDHPAFVAGGARSHRDSGIAAYLVPRASMADTIERARPGVPVAVVGCPALDAWRSRTPPTAATVAVTFHWPNVLCPESMWALPRWERHMWAVVGGLRAAGYEVLGHGHPKAWGYLTALWRKLRVEAVPDVDDVLARAEYLIADNTSLMYEWIELGRPVVALSSPLWRRNVEHGLRFWSMVPGPEYGPDEWEQVASGRALLVADSVEWAERRLAIAGAVYARPLEGSVAAAVSFVTRLEE